MAVIVKYFWKSLIPFFAGQFMGWVSQNSQPCFACVPVCLCRPVCVCVWGGGRGVGGGVQVEEIRQSKK